MRTDGSALQTIIATKPNTLGSSSISTVDRITANIYFASQNADHACVDFIGQSRLLLGSASNTFLYGCNLPSLTVSGAGGNQTIFTNNTSGANYNSLYKNAGGVSAQMYVGGGIAF